MRDTFGPVYEVTHHVDPEIIDEFDAWLGPHTEEMLELPGIIRASTYDAGEDETGRPRRVTLYRFESDADLDSYLEGPAEVMRASAAERFPDRYEVSRRVLHETEIIDGSMEPIESCLNCGTVLRGQYCGECGQRARSRLISIWELTQEAFGDLLELDSRLWRTLIPLAVRPGKLTRDYLEGRRARFMPPFRTYLVLSIFFFLIAFFDPREDLGILFEPQDETAAVQEDPATEETAGQADEPTADEVREEVLNELIDEGVLAEDLRTLPDEGEVAPGDEPEEPSGFNITIDSDGDAVSDSDCEDVDIGEMPPWLASRLTPERLTVVCERVIADDGRAFFGKLLDNVPAGLFILLPLMALILKILYPLSKRFYVEHLLFVVHFHAFVFLILMLQILFNRLVSAISLPEAVTGISVFAVSLYIPIYLYKAMRRVYGQGHFMTTVKFIVLLGAYFFGLSGILMFAALFAAFSI